MGMGAADPPPAADLSARVLAAAVDGVFQLLLVIPFGATLLVITLATTDPSAGPLGPKAPVALLVTAMAAPFVVVGYHAWLEGLYAETLGKRLLGLRVVDHRGAPVTWREALLRNVIRPIDALPVAYVLGIAVAMIDDDHRRLGDVAAGTLVVEREDAREHGQTHRGTLQIGPTGRKE